MDDENRLIDARDTLRRVTRMATVLDKYVRERGIAWQQYAVAYELENMAGVMLWSDSPLYLDYVAKRGALFAAPRIVAAVFATWTMASTNPFALGSLRAAISSKRAACP